MYNLSSVETTEMNSFSPCSQQRDDLEDDELHMHQLTEGMPTTIAGFKNHPLYVPIFHCYCCGGYSRLIFLYRIPLGTLWLVI